MKTKMQFHWAVASLLWVAFMLHTTSAGWTRKARCSAEDHHDVTFLLNARNLDQLEANARAVSDPADPKYGQHWSLEQIRKLTAPPQEEVDGVMEWIAQRHPRARTRAADIATVSAVGDKIYVAASCQELEQLFGVAFHIYQHTEAPSGYIIRTPDRTVSSHVPEELRTRVRAILGLSEFPPLSHQHKQAGRLRKRYRTVVTPGSNKDNHKRQRRSVAERRQEQDTQRLEQSRQQAISEALSASASFRVKAATTGIPAPDVTSSKIIGTSLFVLAAPKCKNGAQPTSLVTPLSCADGPSIVGLFASITSGWGSDANTTNATVTPTDCRMFGGVATCLVEFSFPEAMHWPANYDSAGISTVFADNVMSDSQDAGGVQMHGTPTAPTVGWRTPVLDFDVYVRILPYCPSVTWPQPGQGSSLMPVKATLSGGTVLQCPHHVITSYSIGTYESAGNYEFVPLASVAAGSSAVSHCDSTSGCVTQFSLAGVVTAGSSSSPLDLRVAVNFEGAPSSDSAYATSQTTFPGKAPAPSTITLYPLAPATAGASASLMQKLSVSCGQDPYSGASVNPIIVSGGILCCDMYCGANISFHQVIKTSNGQVLSDQTIYASDLRATAPYSGAVNVVLVTSVPFPTPPTGTYKITITMSTPDDSSAEDTETLTIPFLAPASYIAAAQPLNQGAGLMIQVVCPTGETPTRQGCVGIQYGNVIVQSVEAQFTQNGAVVAQVTTDKVHCQYIEGGGFYGCMGIVSSGALRNYVSTFVAARIRFSDGSIGTFNDPPSNFVPVQSITTKTIRSLYNVPEGMRATPQDTVRQAVVQFVGQFFDPHDLELFAHANGVETPAVDTWGLNIVTDPGGESTLDIQYITATGRGVPTVFWSMTNATVPGVVYDKAAKFNFIHAWAFAANERTDTPEVISISYGAPSVCFGPPNQYTPACGFTDDSGNSLQLTSLDIIEKELKTLALRGISVLVASGDDGVADSSNATMCSPYKVDYPGASPWVTDVGSTALSTAYTPLCRGADVSYGMGISCEAVGEVAATQDNHPTGFDTGGGFSMFFKRPWYQEGVVGEYWKQKGVREHVPAAAVPFPNNRGAPDIAVVGDSFVVVQNGTVDFTGGTSSSAPSLAGMISLINVMRRRVGQPNLGFLNPLLYSLYKSHREVFRDPVLGENKATRDPGTVCPAGLLAAPGWDPLTGLGTPDFGLLLQHALDAGASAAGAGASNSSSSSSSAGVAVGVVALVIAVIGLAAAVYVYRRMKQEATGAPGSSYISMGEA